MIERQISVASFDVYPNSTIKPSALQKYMQQLAREDCDEMGITYPAMREVNMVFVITKMALTVNKPVYAYDNLTIKTYNNSIKGITFCREFEFWRDGEEVIHATTHWVIVRFDTRKLVRPREFPFDIESANLECNEIDIPRKLETENLFAAGERIVRLSDLDENDHLNNCIYSDITMDVLPYDRKNEYVKEVRILFQHEAKLGDVLNLSCGQNNGRFGVSAYNSANGTICFEADCAFEKING